MIQKGTNLANIVEIEGLDEELEFPDDTPPEVIKKVVDDILAAKDPKKAFLAKAKQFSLSKPEIEKEVDKPQQIVVSYDTKVEVFQAIVDKLESLGEENKGIYAAINKLQTQQDILLKTLIKAVNSEKEFIYDRKSGVITGSRIKPSTS